MVYSNDSVLVVRDLRHIVRMTTTLHTRSKVDRHLSKRLSWLLRHGAHEVGLPMDEAGWSPVPAVLNHLKIGRTELESVVAHNHKRRLQLDGERVRACQGHSTENRAVTQEGLERSWTVYTSNAPVWHGTSVDAIDGIAQEGLLPIARTHVHCAPSPDSFVGKRSGVSLLLEIDPNRIRQAGLILYVAPNGVIFVRHVPVNAIVDLIPQSRRGRAQADLIRKKFGWAS